MGTFSEARRLNSDSSKKERLPWVGRHFAPCPGRRGGRTVAVVVDGAWGGEDRVSSGRARDLLDFQKTLRERFLYT